MTANGKDESPAGDRLQRLLAQDGPLASSASGYERRREQVRLAEEVARALDGGGVLLADCPTGTGKSLGYLAPAVLSDQKVVVSTATIALQHQLLTKDLPLLKKAVCLLGGYPEDEGFTYALMKGRSNFLCENRYDETLRDERTLENGVDEAALERIDGWRYETETGDREDLPFPMPFGTWMEIASDGEDCAPNSCRFREGCFYYAHRDAASEADVLVVNHSLLLSNAASFGNIFDTSGRHLIVDEAHRVEEIMSGAFGARFSYPRVRYVVRQASKKSSSAAKHEERLLAAADLFFSDLEQNQALGDSASAPRGYQQLDSSLSALRTALVNDPKEEANRLQGMVGRLRRELKGFYDGGEDSGEYARAVMPGRKGKDTSYKPKPELRSWLVETAQVFEEEVLGLFEEGGVVLSSATLATSASDSVTGRSFEYPRRRLGLRESGEQERSVEEFAGPEIFDYESRCLIYTEPANGNWSVAATISRTQELLAACGGKALVLLSTARAVSAFRESFFADGPVRYQGEDSPSRLVRWLKETEDAVLVGTRTFWEGVDVSGLSLVVIDKVPFPPPDDPVIEALCKRAGKNWFREVSLPKAQVAMRQGSGRLLRGVEDRGVIAILDPRIEQKNWGNAVLGSLPNAPTTQELSEVRQFFERVSGENRKNRSFNGGEAS